MEHMMDEYDFESNDDFLLLMPFGKAQRRNAGHCATVLGQNMIYHIGQAFLPNSHPDRPVPKRPHKITENVVKLVRFRHLNA